MASIDRLYNTVYMVYLVDICDLFIVLVVSIWHHEVTIEQWTFANYLPRLHRELCNHSLTDELLEPLPVLIVDQTILKDTATLMSPQL